MEIKFKENMPYKSQQSIAIFLKSFKYYFIPVSEYDNNSFYLIAKCPESEPLKDFICDSLKWAGVKRKVKYNDFRLNLTVCPCGVERMEMPMVFTQEDVLNIIADVPENYIGKEML